MRLVIATIALVLATPSCSSSLRAEQEARGTPAGTLVPGIAPGVVDAAAARKLVAAGAKVIDVRTPAEFGAGHLPGAVNIPFDEIGTRASEIGAPSTPVLLYCRTGRRTAIANGTLRGLGFTEIYDLRSYELWTASEGSGSPR